MFQGGLPGARWVEPENYHITLRFAGDISADLADDFVEALSAIRFQPFPVTLNEIACFGGKKPRAIYAGITMSEPLARLQMAHEHAAQVAGLPPEGRKFVPHVTLARLNRSTAADVAAYLSTQTGVISESFTVAEFALFSARASQGGGPYLKEAIFESSPQPT